MASLGVLIAVIAVFFANLPAVLEQWRNDRPGFIKTLKLSGVYLLYVFLGIGFLLLIAPAQGTSDDKAAMLGTLFLTGAMVAWIFYGGLLLMRAVPHYREPPRWLTRVGLADAILLGAFAGCLAGHFWVQTGQSA